MGGTWELESRLGQVSNELAFLPEVRLAYAGVFEPDDSGMGLPVVSLSTGPDFLIESKGTKSAHVFNVSGAPLPKGGLKVSVSAPNLSEFDLDEIEVIDGEITAVREDGFDFKVTDLTAIINLPVAEDGEAKRLEKAPFTLEPGEGYEVNSEFSSGSFNLVNTPEQVPPTSTSELNNTIPLAVETGLSSENPSVSFNDSLDFEFGNRYENEDGTFTYVDTTEDVDFYSFELRAGETVTIDADSENPLLDEADTVLRVLDAEGKELALADDSPAPDEIFNSCNDTIYGGAGSDRIGGKAGNDTLYGDSGDDRIWGDAGNDLIYGGRGNDTLDGDTSSVGSASRDTFVLASGQGTDTILDFQVGEDLIGLAEGLTFGQISITQDGNNAVINFEDETLAIVNRVQATTLTSDLFTLVV